MKTLFIEHLHELSDDEIDNLTARLADIDGFDFVLLPAKVHVHEGKPEGGYVFEEHEQDGDDAPRMIRRLVFPTKADLYDFLASPTFQQLEEEAAE